MAKETLDEKIQKEIFEHLQKELMEIPFEEGHDLVQKKLCRKTEISDFLKLLTEKYEGQLEQVKKRLRLKLLPILKNQKERTEHKLFLGRRVDLRNIAAPSGAVFKKHSQEKRWISVWLCWSIILFPCVGNGWIMPFLQHFACMIFVWKQKYRFWCADIIQMDTGMRT